MGRITSIIATAAVAAGTVAIGLTQPAAAQQQDYSTTPGYAANPQGMCWNRSFAAGDENGVGGYWGACGNNSANQSPNRAARAQQAARQRSRPNGYEYAPRR